MTKQQINKPASRRDWFTGPLALLGAGALCSIPARAQATPQTLNDIDVLNTALKLEYLESALYQQALQLFKPADFQNSLAVQTLGGAKTGASIYSYITDIARNEADHVSKLIETIYSFDGPCQAADCYNFGFTTVDSFLETAQTIENLAVAAYNGVIIPQFQTSNSTVANPAVQVLVSAIATVEARHAAYLNILNLTIPFPAAVETPQTMAQVLAAINPYLTAGCSGPPVPLTLAFAGPAKYSTVTTNHATVTLDGSLSTSAAAGPLSYLWQQVLGSPPCSIADVSARTTTAILQGGPGLYTITLKVIDSVGGSDQDAIKFIYQP